MIPEPSAICPSTFDASVIHTSCDDPQDDGDYNTKSECEAASGTWVTTSCDAYLSSVFRSMQYYGIDFSDGVNGTCSRVMPHSNVTWGQAFYPSVSHCCTDRRTVCDGVIPEPSAICPSTFNASAIH